MIQSKTKITELKPKTFQVMARLDTGVDIDLFSKTVISVVGNKHHGHQVITGVTLTLFRDTATYKIHNFLFSCRVLKEVGECLLRATKNRYGLMGEKRDATCHLRVFRYAPDRAVFSVATIKFFRDMKVWKLLLVYIFKRNLHSLISFTFS